MPNNNSPLPLPPTNPLMLINTLQQTPPQLINPSYAGSNPWDNVPDMGSLYNPAEEVVNKNWGKDPGTGAQKTIRAQMPMPNPMNVQALKEAWNANQQYQQQLQNQQQRAMDQNAGVQQYNQAILGNSLSNTIMEASNNPNNAMAGMGVSPSGRDILPMPFSPIPQFDPKSMTYIAEEHPMTEFTKTVGKDNPPAQHNPPPNRVGRLSLYDTSGNKLAPGQYTSNANMYQNGKPQQVIQATNRNNLNSVFKNYDRTMNQTPFMVNGQQVNGLANAVQKDISNTMNGIKQKVADAQSQRKTLRYGDLTNEEQLLYSTMKWRSTGPNSGYWEISGQKRSGSGGMNEAVVDPHALANFNGAVTLGTYKPASGQNQDTVNFTQDFQNLMSYIESRTQNILEQNKATTQGEVLDKASATLNGPLENIDKNGSWDADIKTMAAVATAPYFIFRTGSFAKEGGGSYKYTIR